MDAYTPVDYVYQEVITEELKKDTQGKVFYFDEADAIESCAGRIVALKEIRGKGLFVEMEPPALVRVDRIITLFGKPGAAYDEYDAFANACMDCSGGDDPGV